LCFDWFVVQMSSATSIGRRLFDEMENLAERIFDRQFCDELKSSLTRAGVCSSSTCALDTIEKPDSYLIRADAPGVEKSKIQIDIKGNHLTIKGDRGEEKREETGSFTRFETQRRFSRTVMLPEDANVSNIEASLTRGVLSVSIPKKEQAKRDAKRVEIKGD